MKTHMRFFWAGVAIGAALMWRYQSRAAVAVDPQIEKERQAGRALLHGLEGFKQHRDGERRQRLEGSAA